MQLRNLTVGLLLFVMNFGQANAQSIDGQWIVSDYHGDAIFVDPAELRGKQQDFAGGSAEGVFYSCDFGGQYMIYTAYDFDEFAKTKQFSGVADIIEKRFGRTVSVFVHRINCEGKGSTDGRRILYPFITLESKDLGSLPISYLVFDAGLVEFEKMSSSSK